MRRWNRPWNSVHRVRSVSFSPHSRSKSAAEVSTVLCQWNLLRFSCISAGQRLKPAKRLFAPAGVWIQLYVPLPLGRCSFRRIGALIKQGEIEQDRKSTRLNSSHGSISYAVFCLKKKNIYNWDPHNIAHRKSARPAQNRHPSGLHSNRL